MPRKDEERFLREARLAATLERHPNIVPVYEAGVVKDRPYIAMELIEGLPMHEWLKKTRPSLRAQVALLRDTALAVDVAHGRGIVHRDLNPKNILVDEDHQPHVTDFGLAKRVGGEAGISLTDPQMTVGTPHYMSPEQAQGLKEVDRRTDVYSLGVMLFESLTQRHPFDGETSVQILVKVVRDPVETPSKVLKAAGASAPDPDLERICLKAMEKDPRYRHATALEFAEDLRAWLAGEKISKSRGASPGRAAAWIGAVAVLVLALVVVLNRPRKPPVDSPPPAAPEPTIVEAVWGAESRMSNVAVVGYEGGQGKHAERGGVPCLVIAPNERGERHLHLDLDDEWAASVAAAEVEVEYFDDRGGAWVTFGLQYDSMDSQTRSGSNSKWAGSVVVGETGEWATTTFYLANPRFENELSGECDVCLLTKDVDLAIRRLTVRPFTGEDPEPFKSRPVAPETMMAGLIGEYFSDTELQERAVRRIDPEIAFYWGGEKGPEGLGSHFSARWSGYFRVAEAGRYLIEVRSDNGSRLSIDERPVLDLWGARVPTTRLLYCRFEAGYHKIEYEFQQRGGGAAALFSCLRERGSRMVDLEPHNYAH